MDGITNCTVVVTMAGNDTNPNVQECMDLVQDNIPGSNLYLFVWGSLFASINIALQWKAAQALQFAQTAQRQETESTMLEGKEELEVEDDEDAI